VVSKRQTEHECTVRASGGDVGQRDGGAPREVRCKAALMGGGRKELRGMMDAEFLAAERGNMRTHFWAVGKCMMVGCLVLVP